MEILTVFIIILVGVMIGNQLAFTFNLTHFIRPKGLWNLVPGRVSGWKNPITKEIQKQNWIWQ